MRYQEAGRAGDLLTDGDSLVFRWINGLSNSNDRSSLRIAGIGFAAGAVLDYS